MGRKKKDLLPIMRLIVQELSISRGLPLKFLCDSMNEKYSTRKNHVIDAYKILEKDNVIKVSQSPSDRGREGYFLQLSENIITGKINQIHHWIRLFTEQQKPHLKILKKNTIVIERKKTKKQGETWTINNQIDQDLRRITEQMTNIYRHISALGLAFDMDLIPKIYEKPIRKAQKSGLKFIKDTVVRIVACEKNYPQVLKRYLNAFFTSELIELGYYEKYHESINQR